MMKRFLSFLLLLTGCLQSILAQSGNTDFLRSIGKIYVVVAVIVLIFIGIIAFLIYLERKLTKLENQIKDHDAA